MLDTRTRAERPALAAHDAATRCAVPLPVACPTPTASVSRPQELIGLRPAAPGTPKGNLTMGEAAFWSMSGRSMDHLLQGPTSFVDSLRAPDPARLWLDEAILVPDCFSWTILPVLPLR